MYMGTRLEKRKQSRNSYWIKSIKALVVVMITILLGKNIKAVNNSIVNLNCMDNTNLIYYDNTNNNLELLGKSYYLDLKFIKKYF